MSAILPKLDKKSVVSGNSLKLTVDAKVYSVEFVQLALLYLKRSGSFELIVNESAQPALSLGTLNNISMAIPAKDEQRAVVDYISNINEKIKIIINNCVIENDKLKEYRQSLISEAVTGKIDVRDWEPKN